MDSNCDRKGLDYLTTLEPWRGSGVFSLDPIRKILKEFGDPQDKLPSIHVAGTNGKGSVCATVASILTKAGYRVGLTISPHLVRINERIVINGEEISDSCLNDLALELKQVSEKLSITLTFFEAITAIAFIAFGRTELDYIVVEVGLGGWLDATNIIKSPQACAIVSIDKDHTDLLGEDDYSIASEKGGIIKQSVPVVVGEVSASSLKALSQIASKIDAPLLLFGRDFESERGGSGAEAIVFRNKKDGYSFNYRPALSGRHQIINSGVAAMLASILGIGHRETVAGIENVEWPGRLEEIEGGARRIIIDAAHNPAGITELKGYILDQFGAGCVDIAFGAISTKDWKKMVDILGSVAANWYLLEPSTSQAVRTMDIANYLSGIEISSKEFGREYDRFINEIVLAKGRRPLILAGSIYLIGHLREKIINAINTIC